MMAMADSTKKPQPGRRRTRTFATPDGVAGRTSLPGLATGLPYKRVRSGLSIREAVAYSAPRHCRGSQRGGAVRPGGWWILFEPALHLGEDVLVPDHAGWRRERMPALPDVVGFTLPPDWVCEVISPSTARIDRGRKLRVYAREQVAHLWFVDPLARTIEVYRLEGERWVVAGTYEGAGMLRLEPFAAVDLDVSRWWPAPEAPQ